MAKKKSSRPPSRASSEYDDEAQSVSTASLKSWGPGRPASAGFDVELEEIEDDPFDENIEKLYEKRYTTREAGLTGLISLLTSQWQYEEAVFRQETFTQMFLGSLKRGGAKESELAARALGLHVITLGASDMAERIFKDALPTLEPIILTGKAVASRVAAVDALGMLCFVASEGAHETLPVMALLSKAFTKGVAKLQAAALHSWTLLLSTLSAGQLNSEVVEINLKALAGLLHSDDVEVRAAAGEAVALLYDTCGLSELPESPVDSSGMAAAALALSSPARAAYGRPPLPPSARKNGASPASLSSASPAGHSTHSASVDPGNTGAGSSPGPSIARSVLSDIQLQRPGEADVGWQHTPLGADSLQGEEAAQQQKQPRIPESLELGTEGPDGDSGASDDDECDVGGGIDIPSPAGAGPGQASPQTGSRPRSDQGSDEDGDATPGVPVKKLEDIVSRMKDLAKNRGDASRRSRKERASQRGTFRELCNIVEDGAVPVQKIKLKHGDVLIIDSLTANVRLNAMRRFLAEGFQAHMQDNTLLHQVFNFTPRNEAPEKLTPWEKRMFRSPASVESKARSQQRKKDRATMAAYKGGLLGGGD